MSKFSCWSAYVLSVLVYTVAVAYARPEEHIRQVVTESGKFESHRISSLPGAPEVGFEQYSGYVTIDEKAERALFYWFFEADVKDPQSAPLTLWLNGGPGCSSVGGGALSELGPFYPSKDGKSLIKNPYSWNQVSNVLFLESPAGVGFSYSNTSSDYRTGDAKTAADSVEFILKFLELYPVYAKSPFYISGESYAGHYVPQLAAALLEKNKELGESAVNFKGIAVGNAWTDSSIDNYGAIFFWWSHALISDKTYKGIIETCNFNVGGLSQNQQLSQVDCTAYVDAAGYLMVLFSIFIPMQLESDTLLFHQCNFSAVGPFKSNLQSELRCYDYVYTADRELGNINIYEIYVDVCLSASAAAETKHFAKQLNRHGVGAIGARPLTATDSYDPCVDNEVEEYLNQPDVQKALHVDIPGIPYRWIVCSDIVRYSYSDLLSSVIPVYDILLKSGIQILIFSGDTDAIVPVTGTRAWINTLNLNITRDWRPYYVNSQVGGYVTEYDGLTLATVRGAGHMVPYTQPVRALHLFKSFIDNTPL
ncbi:unnamed protein product [Calypogeia fissa]